MSQKPSLFALFASRVVALVLALMPFVIGHSCLAHSLDNLPVISGRVTDVGQKPLSNVHIKLWADGQGLLESSTSNDQGEFSFTHKRCKSCILEFLPSRTTGLAAALVEVPGEATRTVVVQLRRGFILKGKVMANGEALKGILVRVRSIDNKEGEHHVHGGGAAITARDGTFTLTLTPGSKSMAIINQKYPEFASHIEIPVTVTSDAQLEDIVLPSLSETKTETKSAETANTKTDSEKQK